ncbi:hypothetical protein E3T40_03100 [Cryobacterium sp. TMT1-19]|uniref:hypothetical protein n=1 Tax=Cryobacterium sp. TMT1-19 TaxID=1259231 RepID=UPI00106D8B67|nr:hypothetical protein [Cryobacterium sp. TMT1-19]TFD38447.1 hypothetical protein E3T40_03100 [Cryobacterium sp. TMT1-19]
MNRRLQTALIATMAVAALGLTGCASDAGGGTGAGGELTYEDSPLNKYLSAAYGDYDEEQAIADSKKSEEATAACMAEEGFDYIPVDQSQNMSFDDADMEERETEEWVAANGYGMTQSPEEIAAQQEQSEAYVDPNQNYVASLSETEQSAFYEVLYGPPQTEDMTNEDGSSEYNWEDAGCSGAAQHEINGDNPYEDKTHKPLFDAISKLYENLAKDPGVQALDAEWASCMADSGNPDFSAKQDAINAASELSNVLYNNETGEAPSDEDLAEVREGEIEIALADFTCSEKVDYTAAMLKLQFALEKQFVADHKAELEAFSADYKQGE